MQRLRERFVECCALLERDAKMHTAPRHDGSAHVERHQGRFHYVVTERGAELERRIAEDEDELLFWLVSDLVFELANRYELEHRVPGRSFRRLLFSRKVELMAKVDPAWAARTSEEIREILERHPYDDEAEG